MATFKKSGKKGQEKWTIVFDLPGCIPRKQKRLSGFKTRTEANLAHIAFLANYKPTESMSPSEKLTNEFETVFKDYLKFLSHSIKESTYLNTENNYRSHILPPLRDKQIQEITSKDISDVLISLGKKGLSHDKIKN